MAEQVGLLVKVFVVSALGSALIKYGVASVVGNPAAPSHLVAFVAITLPSVIMGGIIWWRSQQTESVK